MPESLDANYAREIAETIYHPVRDHRNQKRSEFFLWMLWDPRPEHARWDPTVTRWQWWIPCCACAPTSSDCPFFWTLFEEQVFRVQASRCSAPQAWIARPPRSGLLHHAHDHFGQHARRGPRGARNGVVKRRRGVASRAALRCRQHPGPMIQLFAEMLRGEVSVRS